MRDRTGALRPSGRAPRTGSCHPGLTGLVAPGLLEEGLGVFGGLVRCRPVCQPPPDRQSGARLCGVDGQRPRFCWHWHCSTSSPRSERGPWSRCRAGARRRRPRWPSGSVRRARGKRTPCSGRPPPGRRGARERPVQGTTSRWAPPCGLDQRGRTARPTDRRGGPAPREPTKPSGARPRCRRSAAEQRQNRRGLRRAGRVLPRAAVSSRPSHVRSQTTQEAGECPASA